MVRHCEICGREIEKTVGPIGPTCMRKFATTKRKIHRIPKSIQIEYARMHDIFPDGGQDQKEESADG